MKRQLFFFICTIFLFTAQTWGQTWELTETMTATLSNGTLTVSTTADTEAMPDYADQYGKPWFGIRTNIRSVVIENRITSIGTYCFYDCRNLTSVSIPNSVTMIGDWAFYMCGLTSLTLPNSITTIRHSAFGACTRLTSVSLPNVTTIESHAFGSCNALASISIPNAITIGESAFRDCHALTSIAMPNVTTIGGYAFWWCHALTSVTMPNVTTIGDCAFYGDYTFYGYTSTLASVTMPNVRTIGYAAFGGCTALTSISIPYATTIAGSAFYGCTALTSVTMPNITTIGDYAFQHCTSLTSVTMPNVTTIGYSAFLNCTSLTSLTIPKSVTSISDYAFGSCTGLKNVSVAWDDPFSDDWLYSTAMFSSVNLSDITLHVPPGTKSLYEAAVMWKDFGTIVETGVVPEVTQPASGNGSGAISLSLYVPSDVSLSGSFEIQFPDGFGLDEQLTVLSLEFSGNATLSFTFKGNNTWLIEINPSALKSSSASEYRKIMDVAYKTTGNIPAGAYTANIMNLDFTMEDGTPIREDLMEVAISVNPTAVEHIPHTPLNAYFSGSMLLVESPYAETVTVYSVTGAQLLSTVKDEGAVNIPFSTPNGSVVIIRGSKSGSVKTVKRN